MGHGQRGLICAAAILQESNVLTAPLDVLSDEEHVICDLLDDHHATDFSVSSFPMMMDDVKFKVPSSCRAREYILASTLFLEPIRLVFVGEAKGGFVDILDCKGDAKARNSRLEWYLR